MLLFFLFPCHFLFNTKSTRKIGFGLSLRLPSVYPKAERKMDPIFEHPIFHSAREKVKHVMRQLEKPQSVRQNSLYTCFKCGSIKIFSIAKQVRSADEGMTVFNEGRDCHNKWMDCLCDRYLIKI